MFLKYCHKLRYISHVKSERKKSEHEFINFLSVKFKIIPDLIFNVYLDI